MRLASLLITIIATAFGITGLAIAYFEHHELDATVADFKASEVAVVTTILFDKDGRERSKEQMSGISRSFLALDIAAAATKYSDMTTAGRELFHRFLSRASKRTDGSDVFANQVQDCLLNSRRPDVCLNKLTLK